MLGSPELPALPPPPGCEVTPDVDVGAQKFCIKLLVAAPEGMSEIQLRCRDVSGVAVGGAWGWGGAARGWGLWGAPWGSRVLGGGGASGM